MPAASIQSISSARRKKSRPPDLTTRRSVCGWSLAEVLDERQQPAAEVAGLVAFDLLAGALERVVEALAVERLQQVVERPDLERPQRVLIVGGDEDDERHALGADRLDHLEAVHLRHLHVEEHQVRRVIQDGGDGLLAVAALADDLDVRLGAKQARQPLARERFVVDDQAS